MVKILQSLKLKHILIILVPLILVILGILYYHDLLRILGFTKPVNSNMPVNTHKITNQVNQVVPSGVETVNADSTGNSTISHDLKVKKVQEEVDYTNSDDVNAFFSVVEGNEEEVANAVADVFTNLPSGLKNLRDPFQSILTKTEKIVQSTEDIKKNTGEEHDQVKANSTDVDEQDLTYEDLINSLQTSEQESIVQFEEPVKPMIQYPPFELKGLVSQAGRQKAILVAKGQSFIISNGDHIQDWLITEINQSGVFLVNQEGQRFRMTLEGVSIDEETTE